MWADLDLTESPRLANLSRRLESKKLVLLFNRKIVDNKKNFDLDAWLCNVYF
jgi:hypothetical protein